MREQIALRVVDERFGRDPAHALDEPADDLPAIDARIDRAADVDQQIDARHAQLAGEAIDEHLGDRGALRVIEERRALAGLAIEIDARRGVEAAGAQIDAVAAGLGAKLAERDSLLGPAAVEHVAVAKLHVRADAPRPGLGIGQPRGRESPQPPLDLPAGLDGGRAVEIGAGRGGRRRRVVVLLRAGRHQHARGPRRCRTRRPQAAGSSR